MITLQDIDDMTCLTREEIAAVAEHEHVPELDAALMGDYIMRLHKGPQKVQKMICDDIREALQRDDLVHARDLYTVLHHFLDTYPEAARGAE
jgi:threonine aldolase